MGKAITYQDIKISTFKLLYVKQLKITASVNNHSSLRLTGVLAEDIKDEIIHTKSNTSIEVYTLIEDCKETLYNGVITAIKVRTNADYSEVEIEAKGHTYLMDLKKRKRSFQDKNQLSHSLIKSVVNDYPQGQCILRIPNKPTDKLWVQYEETDWEFVKRIASYYNVGIFSNITLNGIRFFVDVANVGEKAMGVQGYTVNKQLQTYYSIRENEKTEVQESDFIGYTLNSYDVLELGDALRFNGNVFFIFELTYEIVEGILENTYGVTTKGGQKKPTLYHEKIKGVSLEGKVVDVTGDKVKVKFDIDKAKEQPQLYWFTYSTIAASPDGSGWYFMPEIGDRVRVYFPTADEKDSFAINCIQQTKGNPEVKYITTIYDKKVIFKKESVIITANGEATIVLRSDGTIAITGSNSVSVNASQNINLRAEEDVIISGRDSVNITCDKGGKIMLTDAGEIQLKGTEIKIN